MIDIVKDLGLNLKELGITGWTENGIFLKDDVTIDQIQSIAKLIHARHGHPCPEFRECR